MYYSEEDNLLKQAYEEFENTKDAQDVIRVLVDRGYSRSDLAFALDVDILSIERWKQGSGMKPVTYQQLKDLVTDVLNGKSRIPISVSDTGFVSSEYVFKKRQPLASWIWYFSEEEFLLNRSRTISDDVLSLLDASKQDAGDTARNPRIVYVFPQGSTTESDLVSWLRWIKTLEDSKKLRGAVLGLRIADYYNYNIMPWLGLPGARLVMLDIDNKFEAYLRLRLPVQNEGKLMAALGNGIEDGDQLPWLQINQLMAQKIFTDIVRKSNSKIQKHASEYGDDEFIYGILTFTLEELSINIVKEMNVYVSN